MGRRDPAHAAGKARFERPLLSGADIHWGRIDIQPSQIMTAAKWAKPLKWVVLRT
jgi:hypothetical protein